MRDLENRAKRNNVNQLWSSQMNTAKEENTDANKPKV